MRKAIFIALMPQVKKTKKYTTISYSAWRLLWPTFFNVKVHLKCINAMAETKKSRLWLCSILYSVWHFMAPIDGEQLWNNKLQTREKFCKWNYSKHPHKRLCYLPAGSVLPEEAERCGEPVVDVMEGQLLVGGFQNSLEQGGGVTLIISTKSSLLKPLQN